MKFHSYGVSYIRMVIALVLVAAVVGLTPAARPGPPANWAEGNAQRGSGWAGLSPTDKAAISATLGRDDSAYRVVRSDEGLWAANPKHGVMASFTSDGVYVSTGAERWGMALSAYGYGDLLAQVDAAIPQANANRVEYERGPIREWYVNGPLGLEQGFNLDSPPGERGDDPLTLKIALSGDLAAVREPGGGLILKRADGTAALHYSGLTAYDATGHELSTWMELSDSQLLLRVADASAHYPVVVDPLFQAANLTASDGAASDFFGSSIAIHGDTVVVGAALADVGGRANQGAAYVFVKPTMSWAGTLTQNAKLIASDGAALDNFGGAVSVSGDTLVIGARSASVGASAAQGAAYVFVRPAGGWAGTLTQSAKLVASDGAAGNMFGIAVGIDGNTVVAGALSHSIGANIGQGAAYVFVKPVGGWAGTLTQNAKLIASDGAAGDGMAFGAVSFDTIVVGAPFKTVGANESQGAAYVFIKPGSGWAGTLTQNAKLIASDGAANDGFGAQSAISGETIVIGASDADISGRVDQGAAYVFVEPGTGWAGTLTQNAKLITSDGAANDLFGLGSASVSGNTVAIGAGGADVGGKPDQGAAYVFVKPAGGWAGTSTQSQKLTIANGAAGDALGGFAVGISGDTIAVGVSGSDVGSTADQGASYVFTPLRPMLFLPVFFQVDASGW
ncbi:MAG: FG-GAP repeat protein [Chloroflexi bacterium]|nr:FG-GAP repeat protein [Chloroflexota bacterium]